MNMHNIWVPSCLWGEQRPVANSSVHTGYSSWRSPSVTSNQCLIFTGQDQEGLKTQLGVKAIVLIADG